MFKNKMLRRIFGLKREQVEEGWRKVHNEIPHEFYPSRNITIIKLRIIQGGACSMHRKDQQFIQHFCQ